MLSSSRFLIRLLNEDDRQSAYALLVDSFFIDEPVARHLHLETPVEFAQTLLDEAIRDRCSFVAFDLQNNRLVGICLNEIKSRDEKPSPVPSEWDEKLRFILQLFDHMHDHVNLFDRLQTDSLLHLFIVSVDRSARGHGLASRLIAASVEHAKQMNIGGAYAEATNIYSFVAFQQQHFQVYFQLIYEEYDRTRLATLNDQSSHQCQLVARTL